VQGLLAPGDEEHVVEKDDVDLGSLAAVEKDEEALDDDLPPGADDEALARLFRQRGLRSRQAKILVFVTSHSPS
jgi:hypothetical protein